MGGRVIWLPLGAGMKQWLRGEAVKLQLAPIRRRRQLSPRLRKTPVQLATISEPSRAGVAFNDRLSATTPAPPSPDDDPPACSASRSFERVGETPAEREAPAGWISCLIVPPLGEEINKDVFPPCEVVCIPFNCVGRLRRGDLYCVSHSSWISPLENHHLQRV